MQTHWLSLKKIHGAAVIEGGNTNIIIDFFERHATINISNSKRLWKSSLYLLVLYKKLKNLVKPPLFNLEFGINYVFFYVFLSL